MEGRDWEGRECWGVGAEERQWVSFDLCEERKDAGETERFYNASGFFCPPTRGCRI